MGTESKRCREWIKDDCFPVYFSLLVCFTASFNSSINLSTRFQYTIATTDLVPSLNRLPCSVTLLDLRTPIDPFRTQPITLTLWRAEKNTKVLSLKDSFQPTDCELALRRNLISNELTVSLWEPELAS